MVPEAIVLEAQRILQHEFAQPALLIEAITHSSLADERCHSNERMEFLGDAILGMVICQRLFELFPEQLEGDLTKTKSAVVSRRTCAKVAKHLGLGALLQVGREMDIHAPMPESLLAGVMEAVIAALYLDAGLEKTRAFILEHMEPSITHFAASTHHHNFKSLLQQYVQQQTHHAPQYEVVEITGPDHRRTFQIRVVIQEQAYAPAWGDSKKKAEQEAARLALEALGVLPTTMPPPVPEPITESPAPETPAPEVLVPTEPPSEVT